MKKLIIPLLLIISQGLYGQVNIEGNWYMVSRNNLRLTKISQNSIFQQTMDGFTLEKGIEYDTRKSLRILDKKENGDTLIYQVSSPNKDTLDMSFWFDTSVNPTRLFQKIYPRSKTDGKSILFRWVHEDEIRSYDKLLSLSEMSAKDFLSFAEFSEELKEKGAKLSRHFMFAEIKYKLVDMGYDPRFMLSQLQVKLEKFADQKSTKDAYGKMFN